MIIFGSLHINTPRCYIGVMGKSLSCKVSVIWFLVIFRQNNELFEDLIIEVLSGRFRVHMLVMQII